MRRSGNLARAQTPVAASPAVCTHICLCPGIRTQMRLVTNQYFSISFSISFYFLRTVAISKTYFIIKTDEDVSSTAEEECQNATPQNHHFGKCDNQRGKAPNSVTRSRGLTHLPTQSGLILGGATSEIECPCTLYMIYHNYQRVHFPVLV